MEKLKEALQELTSAFADTLFDKMCAASEQEGYWDSEPGEVRDFVMEAGKVFLGYYHGSDYYDNGGYVADYSEDDDSYNSDLGALSDVKDEFGRKLLTAFDEKDLQSVPGFDKLYALAQKAEFKGTKDELEKLLKISNAFGDMAFRMVTRYDG